MNTQTNQLVSDNWIDTIYARIVLNRTIFEGIKNTIEGIDRLENYFYLSDILDANINRFIKAINDDLSIDVQKELMLIEMSERVIEDILVSY